MRIAGRAAVVVMSMLSLAACSASDRASTGDPSTSTNSSPTSAATSPSSGSSPATNASGPVCTAADIKVTGAAGQKPTITIPTTCQPPKDLLSVDLTPGTGAAIKAGDTADMNYLLVTWSDQKEVDTSWQAGRTPYQMKNVGQSPVIQGWNEGMIGLKEGGRRLLVVPGDKGYGPQGRAPIKPNETLVFVVDAVKVTPAQ
ncbi:FKBP-type peptidyl-prolyl cis-trans isomerase [Solihabitans fulvus]|uniref:Peptidyl-prolyl cis-trans isomerase n=1 Tax=Solihabitans fulvus TaxID=1892852 RepID=A0A5B2XDK3_9PSEU|nr:FKBP-type peptidyl-prolyl cis-trans isomerase [Solihabitans fulvus]KAA2261767.1 FKBP-type peptidyl-prolyl cis-trans isomerase [Solihabitans fulvus]